MVNKQGGNIQPEGNPEVNSNIDNTLVKLTEKKNTIIQMGEFSGPLPPPYMLGEYKEIMPDAPERIFSLAENEQSIRKRDNAWILANDSARVWGSIIVSLALVGAALYCGIIGQPWLGAMLGGSGAIGIVVRSFNRQK